ncbi:MAG TPA: MFS transporter [Gemmatales bacterium]|nr:MFS transporter [Gemmatales bacterium]HMP16533.1 MFS transporter [Gemmatales bacterium]
MSDAPAPKLTTTHWLILSIAAIGFAFDIYELLVWPLVGRPALEQLLGVDQFTVSGNQAILNWFSYIMYASAICGGVFGLLGGYLTDWFGRRRVLTYSILLYAFSALASGFATSPEMLLVFRCLTFIGVCVEFVAATAWLAELFTHPKQREAVLGYTQAFSSFGGLMVTGAYWLCNQYAQSLPAIYGEHEAWRYTLISGVLPAIPLIIIRPFLPESPIWEAKRQAGTLTRPSFMSLFSPELIRVTVVTTILMMCGYGVAFGAIQLLPQIVPGLVPGAGQIAPLRAAYEAAKKAEPGDKATADALARFQVETVEGLKQKAIEVNKKTQATVSQVQLWQELGGLVGRFALAYLAVVIVSRRALLRIFQIPALMITPFVFWYFATGRAGENSLFYLQIGIFLAAFFIVGQFSFWGNYLPRVYPVKLRGTGESFAANVGGRLLGTSGNPLALLFVLPVILPMVGIVAKDFTPPLLTAHAAAFTAGFFCVLAVLVSFFLPEPKYGSEAE